MGCIDDAGARDGVNHFHFWEPSITDPISSVSTRVGIMGMDKVEWPPGIQVGDSPADGHVHAIALPLNEDIRWQEEISWMVHCKALIGILVGDGGNLAIGIFEPGDRKGSEGQGLDNTDIHTRLAQGNGLLVYKSPKDRIFSIRVPGSEKKNPHSNSAANIGNKLCYALDIIRK